MGKCDNTSSVVIFLLSVGGGGKCDDRSKCWSGWRIWNSSLSSPGPAGKRVVGLQLKGPLITACQRSCGKLMLSLASFCPQGVGIPGPRSFLGVSIPRGEYLGREYPGPLQGSSTLGVGTQGVSIPGGGYSPHSWHRVTAPKHVRLASKRYASHWNAFLLFMFSVCHCSSDSGCLPPFSDCQFKPILGLHKIWTSTIYWTTITWF